MLLQFKFRPYNTRKQRFHPPHHDHAQRATFFWRSFLRAMFGAVAVAKAGGAEKRSESTILRVRATLPSVVERTQRLSTYVNDVCTAIYICMCRRRSLRTTMYMYYIIIMHRSSTQHAPGRHTAHTKNETSTDPQTYTLTAR